MRSHVFPSLGFEGYRCEHVTSWWTRHHLFYWFLPPKVLLWFSFSFSQHLLWSHCGRKIPAFRLNMSGFKQTPVSRFSLHVLSKHVLLKHARKKPWQHLTSTGLLCISFSNSAFLSRKSPQRSTGLVIRTHHCYNYVLTVVCTCLCGSFFFLICNPSMRSSAECALLFYAGSGTLSAWIHRWSKGNLKSRLHRCYHLK